MQLNLKNPLVFFDIESTGLDVSSDKIVEISAVKVMPDGSEDEKTYRFDPMKGPDPKPISAEAQSIHGISQEDLEQEPSFKARAKALANWLAGCDIAGYNSLKFDIPLLSEEFNRCGVDFEFRDHKLVDVQTIFHKMEQRTLKAAYKFYCDKELENAHSANADTMATYEVLKAQLDRYSSDLKNDIDFLSDFTSKTKFVDYAGRLIYNDKNEPCFNFGKHKGKRVVDVFTSEPSYYSWMMAGSFTSDTKKELTKIYIKLKQAK